MKIQFRALMMDNFAGKVSRSIYDYFASHQISLTSYIPAGYLDDLEDMPIEAQFIRGGNLYSACNLWYEQGLFLPGTQLVVIHENAVIFDERLIDWQNNFHQNIQFIEKKICFEDFNIADDEAVFMGSYTSRKLEIDSYFFDFELPDETTFNPKLLEITYSNIMGTKLIISVKYNTQSLIPNEDDDSMLFDWQRAWWYLPNDELPYDVSNRFIHVGASRSLMLSSSVMYK